MTNYLNNQHISDEFVHEVLPTEDITDAYKQIVLKEFCNMLAEDLNEGLTVEGSRKKRLLFRDDFIKELRERVVDSDIAYQKALVKEQKAREDLEKAREAREAYEERCREERIKYDEYMHFFILSVAGISFFIWILMELIFMFGCPDDEDIGEQIKYSAMCSVVSNTKPIRVIMYSLLAWGFVYVDL